MQGRAPVLEDIISSVSDENHSGGAYDVLRVEEIRVLSKQCAHKTYLPCGCGTVCQLLTLAD